MSNSPIVTILIMTLVVGIAGCASRVPVPPYEVRARQPEQYIAIAVPATISGVVLRETDSASSESARPATAKGVLKNAVPRKLVFDSSGGAVDFERNVVIGVVKDSGVIEVAFDDLLYVEMTGTDIGRWFATPDGLETSRGKALEEPGRLIKPGSLPYWDAIEFDSKKAVYDSSNNVIAGTSKKGHSVEVELGQVQQLQVKTYDAYKQVRIVIGLAGLVAVFFGTKSIFTL